MNEGIENKLNWEKVNGLVPVVVQNSLTGEVLMLGYMSKEALKETIEIGFGWFYSRTKQRLWKKGETSGNVLKVESIKMDCDYDALLMKVTPTGPTCHTGTKSCFGEETSFNELRTLIALIKERKEKMPEGSYTAQLFKEGLTVIAAKVVEEATEVMRAAKKESKERLIEEVVDLLFHLMVLLVETGITYEEVEAELKKRMGKVPEPSPVSP